MLDNPKAWWTLLFIQCTMVALVLGAYFGMKTNILTMKDELRLMNVRVRALEEQLSTNALTPKVAAPTQVPSTAPGPSASDGVGTTPVDSAHQSPVCVNKMTHLVIPCGLASKCLGANNFDGDYFKKIRQKLGLAESDVMMICDEKSADDAAPSPEPRTPRSKSEPAESTGAQGAPAASTPPSGTSQQYGL